MLVLRGFSVPIGVGMAKKPEDELRGIRQTRRADRVAAAIGVAMRRKRARR
jgi:hypothetical protein